MRTYVRVRQATLRRRRRSIGRGRVDQLGRVAAPARAPSSRRQLPLAPGIRAARRHLHRALRSDGGAHRRSPRGQPAARFDGNPRARIELQPRPPQAPPVRRGPQAARLRTVRPGRAVARPAHVADPRPHQRRGDRQPPREPADRVPELCCDAGHALWQGPAPPAHGASVPRVRRAVRGGEPRAALLLARVLCPGPSRRSPAPPPRGRPPAAGAAARRDRGVELERRRPRYGVSDNAVRKWVRQYERQRSPPDAPQTESGGRLPPTSPRPAKNAAR